MTEPIVIARAGVKRLQELQRVLSSRSIASDIVCPPGANTNAWGTTLWLAVAGPVAKEAFALLEAHEYEQLDDAGRRAADTVIDLEADESTCPACTDAIPRGSTRCPGCGLRIG